MARAIQGQNLTTTMAVVLLGALVLLGASVFVIGQSTTGDLVGRPAISSEGDGASRVDDDPYLDRHSDVVARFPISGDTPAMSQDGAGGSSLTRDPAVERHAAVVARYLHEDPR